MVKKKMNEKREIVLKSRKYAMIDIAYNINKMCFLPKLYSNYTYRIDNLIRIMANLLRKDYRTGLYVTSKWIKDENLELDKNDRYGVIFEFLKEDEETGKKGYNFFYMYNIEQLVGYEQNLELYLKNVDKKSERKKYNLREENLVNFLEKNEKELLIKILFNGLLNLKTGKNIRLNYKLDQGAKNILIEMCKQDVYIKEMRKSFKKANDLLIKYLNENELKKEGDINGEWK